MTTNDEHAVHALPCPDLDEALRYFRDRLGFRLDAIAPADDPSVAAISGHGLRLILKSNAHDDADTALHMLSRSELMLPDLVPSFALTRMDDDAWKTGRAGMLYRDLIPDRQGGRFIASHIRIVVGGPVADSVHFHDIRFQAIYCVKGWVRLVYEDQGPPFVLNAGDCVLQPPRMRHRVLEASPGLEVVEIACPAQHPTYIDHDLALPTENVDGKRSFSGQTFVRHETASASWSPWWLDGLEQRDTGIAAATDGLASVVTVRRTDAPLSGESWTHAGELFFVFVLGGSMRVHAGDEPPHRVEIGDACVIAPSTVAAFRECTDDVALLIVMLPSAPVISMA